MFHALATEGNASKYFVARVCASAMINRDDAHFTMHILRSMYTKRSVNEGINSVFSAAFALDAKPNR